jgi:hypothetical protein
MLFDELGRPVRRQAVVVKHIELQKTTSLAAGATEQDDFTVPVDRSWRGRRVRAMAHAPTGSASGSHTATLVVPSVFAPIHPIFATTGHNAFLSTDVDTLGLAIGSGRIMRLEYSNSTNVAQTNPRNWHIIFIEEVS